MNIQPRITPVLAAIGNIRELTLIELLHITEALHKKVKSSMDLNTNEAEDCDADLDMAESTCRLHLKKRQAAADRDEAEYDYIMEHGSPADRKFAALGDQE